MSFITKIIIAGDRINKDISNTILNASYIKAMVLMIVIYIIFKILAEFVYPEKANADGEIENEHFTELYNQLHLM